jgi:hypothetical protein
MLHKWQLCLLPVSMALLTAGDQPWKKKQIAEWNEDDAKQILTDSPWVKSVTPTIDRSANGGQRRPGGMDRGGGVGLGGIGIGLPGMGGGSRRGGMGGPGMGGGYPGGGQTRGPDDQSGTGYGQPPTLTLRWESALPVREAELKAHETNAPAFDESHYAIALYGLPARMLNSDSRSLADELKKQASIKRDGKKDMKPSSVEVLQREDGPVIVYLFPRSREFTKEDKRLNFSAHVGRLQFSQSFYLEEMVYQAKLEL